MDPLLKILQQHPATVAPQLLGWELVVEGSASIITEVEAYGGVGEDPASHAFRRMTLRNQVMFANPGHLYVYFTYGMHWCANVVSHQEGEAGAILIRATREVIGPARLCAKLGITGADNGLDLTDTRSRVQIRPHLQHSARVVRSSTRIGISKAQEREWRFFLDGEPISGSAQKRADTAG